MRKKKPPLKKLNIRYKPTIRQTTRSVEEPSSKTHWVDDVDQKGDVKLKKLGTASFN